MVRDKNSLLKLIALMALTGVLLGMAVWSNAHASSSNTPLQQAGTSDPPTNTPTNTPTDTLTNTPTNTPTATHTFTPTASNTLTVIPTASTTAAATQTHTFTPTPTYTTTASHTPIAPAHIVISQFRTTGPKGEEDEFIELYNPTGGAVNIGSWYINISDCTDSNLSTLPILSSSNNPTNRIAYNTILQPGQHYLLAAYDPNHDYSSIDYNLADAHFTPGIPDDGGLALFSSSGILVDQVGMCANTLYREGAPLAPLPITPGPGTPTWTPTLTPEPGTPTSIPGSFNQSYERLPDGSEHQACYDTTNNANDFTLLSPSDPQNMDSDMNMCSGVQIFTLTPTPIITPTRTKTPTRTATPAPGVAVLNEFLPHAQTDWNGDGTANVGDEYIEIINVSSLPLNVKGWRLDLGEFSDVSFSIPDLLLQARQIAVFYNSQTHISLSDGGATVRLLRSDGRIIDVFTYPTVEVADQAWCRLPDGTGTWGFVCRPTPGRPNALALPGMGSNSICIQGNNAPQWLIFSECGTFGSGILDESAGRLFWLQDRWRWGVFLE